MWPAVAYSCNEMLSRNRCCDQTANSSLQQGHMPWICQWGTKPKARRPTAGWDSEGRGQQPIPYQLGGSGDSVSVVSSPSGVQGGAPTAQRSSTIFTFQHSGWPLLTLILTLTLISCSHWGQDPMAPPLAYTQHYRVQTAHAGAVVSNARILHSSR